MSIEQGPQDTNTPEQKQVDVLETYFKNVKALHRIKLQNAAHPNEIKDRVPSDIKTVSGYVVKAEECLHIMRSQSGEDTIEANIYFTDGFVYVYKLGLEAASKSKRTLEGIDKLRLWKDLIISYENSSNRLKRIARHRNLNPQR